MTKIDVEIDSWLQDAVAYELKNLVREKVRVEHRVSEGTHIDVYSPEFSYGVIDIRWGYGLYPDSTIGFKSFSLKEVLNMIMSGNSLSREKEAMVGYNLKNCVPCCFDCNGLKSNRDLDKWLDKMEKILKFRGKI